LNRTSRQGTVGIAIFCAILAGSVHLLRRQQIRDFFADRPPMADFTSLDAARAIPPSPGPDRSLNVRIVLLDGLGYAAAQTLPHLQALCTRGHNRRIDVGFPTVSLPVQHVLWTGLTQQESGILYRQQALDVAPRLAIPAGVAGAQAVAQSHGFIARSFGFGEVWVGGEGSDSAQTFEDVAKSKVASSAPLVFIHMLEIDEAGHLAGPESAAYQAAIKHADEALSHFVAARPEASWLVLADHGHRQGGGHGDAESELRVVQGCWWGSWPELQAKGHVVALTAVSAMIRAAVGQEVEAGWAPLEMPQPSRVGIAIAATLWLLWSIFLGYAGLAVRAFGALLLALLGVLLVFGIPSLSLPAIFPPLGLSWLRSSLPFLLVIAFWGGRQPLATLIGGVGTIFMLALGLAFALEGIDGWSAPQWNLIPFVSAWLSAALWHLAAASLALVIGIVVAGMASTLRQRRARRRPAR
jgi:hypothetical protein